MSDLVIETKKLTKIYGEQTAVNSVNLHVKQGRIYGLLGRNGAGKTTIMKMILGLTPITSGEVDVFGQNIKGHEKRIYPRIGAIIETPGFYPNLTGTENLEIFAKLRGTPQPNAVKNALEVVGLPYKDKKLFSKYSLGMKQRLGIANAILHDPELLILDEPTNGLDPIGIAEVRNFIKNLSVERGKTILISSHILSEISLLADDIGIIDHGVLLEESSMEELEKKNKEIQELENENIEISKKRHTIVHKQKSLERKLEEIIMKSEISTEEAEKVKVRLEKLNSEIYNKKEVIELDKTGIENIDDMLKYMQIECIKNKIDFTLKITGNIYYMINNLINKEDLETLLADHIKDAIIAINHTENINKSILVRLGEIDGNYGLYIYDSGVEFPKEVLENLGKKPCTTYKNEGGTGMGFMNTFDTLRKCNASLIIEELNEPKEDNYTKIVEIKFDKKNEFKVNSYKNKNR